MGRMGSLCAREFLDDQHSVVIVDPAVSGDSVDGIEMHRKFSDVTGRVDCLLDVSTPAGVSDSVSAAKTWHCPLAIGTTGLDQATRQAIADAAKEIPVLIAPNLSLSVMVMHKLARQAAEMLGEYDIEIVEAHHRNKADAPSGTALSLANAIATVTKGPIRFNRTGKRQANEIGIASVRGGGLVGEHEVMFLGDFDSLNINLRTNDRRVLAKGAVFFTKQLIAKKPGLWSVEDLA